MSRLPDPSFWVGRRVFLTGHTGFKGSWLAFWLARMGARVTGFALAPETEPAAFALLDIPGRVDSQFGDVRDAEALDCALNAAAPEIVVHLAAQPLVLRGYREPAATFAANVMGTVNLFEAVRKSSDVRAVVVVTTDKVYAENTSGAAYRESDTLGGADPYAASKACAEIVSASYREAFFRKAGVALATVRAGNVIGGGDWSAERLIPDLVRAITTGNPLTLRHPEATRPWQHVLEPLAAYLILAEQLCETTQSTMWAERAWNIGPDPADTATVGDVVRRFEHTWSRTTVATSAAAEFHEAPHLTVDATAARELLGWSPQLRLDDAIDLTAEWYRDLDQGETAAVLTARQIDAYMRARNPDGSASSRRSRTAYAAGA